jgi:hypothetical protein
MSIANWAGIAVMFALGISASAPQADCDWQLLGQRAVDHRADHDEIAVTSSDGTFNGIQLRVKGAPVAFKKVTVYFRNGTQQVLDMRDEIPDGGQTRTIDLEGKADERNITRVAFDYRTEEPRGERAVVQLWGQT